MVEKPGRKLYAAMALHSLRQGSESQCVVAKPVTRRQRNLSLVARFPRDFYDAKTHKLIHLPENYFGVAARIRQLITILV